MRFIKQNDRLFPESGKTLLYTIYQLKCDQLHLKYLYPNLFIIISNLHLPLGSFSFSKNRSVTFLPFQKFMTDQPSNRVANQPINQPTNRRYMRVQLVQSEGSYTSSNSYELFKCAKISTTDLFLYSPTSSSRPSSHSTSIYIVMSYWPVK